MKRILLIVASLFVCLYFFVVESYAQGNDFYFEHITTEDGLSHNSVQSIYQDSEGFMWFGTSEGLNKYDGYDFMVYRPNPKNPEHSLTHNVASDIYEDSKGHLWIATFGGGLNLIDKQSGMVKSFNVNPTNIPEWNVFFSIFEDHEGMLWLGNGLGAVKFDPVKEEFTLFEHKRYFFADIIEDSSHRLWAAGERGLYQLDRQSGIFTPIPVDTGLNKQPDCSQLFLDQDGLLWIGTNGEGIFKLDTHHDTITVTKVELKGIDTNPSLYNRIIDGGSGYLWIASANGLYWFNKETSEALKITTNQQLPGSLSHYNVGDVFKDRNGNIWVGTENGLNVLRHHTKKFAVYQLSPALPSQPLFENNINKLLQDHTGKIWLSSSGSIASGGNYKKGLYSFDRKTRQFQYYSAAISNPDSLESNDVTALYIDKKNRLWVGTIEALHLYDSISDSFKRFYTELPVRHIHEDSSGKIWIAGNGYGKDGEFISYGGFAVFNPRQEKFRNYIFNPENTIGLKSDCVSDLIVSNNDNIWVGSFSHGFLSFDPKTDSYTHYLASAMAKQGVLNDKHVEVLYEDARGTLWVGTNQGGLHKFDLSNETFTFYTIENGLASNHIVSIIADDHKRLWIGTNQGLSCFDPTTEKFKNYNTSDGLPSDGFCYKSVYASDGKLMFGTDNGFVIFDPDSIQDNTTLPPVYITGFQVMDEARAVPSGPIELAHDENFLSFDFVALNYDAPEKNQYAFMLEGVDKDWVYSNTRRFASYTNLDPGAYTFRVKASNNDGIWNEEGTSLHVTILPPWWQTGWAYALYTVLGLSLLYSLRQYTVKRERLKHELSIQRMEAEKMHEVDQLKSRFFANISHEFRTPLTLLLGPLDKLMTEPAYAKEHSLFSMMQRNAQRLLHLINQLLDLSKLEAGRMNAEVKAGAIVPFLQSIGLSFATLAERQQISYHFQYPQEHVVVYFDADKLEKIITNLLSNAFKFTPAGGSITFSARIFPEKKAALSTPVEKPEESSKLYLLELKVQDSGVGLSEEQLAHVFHRFYQAETSQQATEGSGIGLSLVRELVELHGGEVSATSEAEKGSCFTVKLPLWQASFAEIIVDQQTTANGKEQLLPSAASGYESNGKSIDEDTPPDGAALDGAPLILIVEDNADVRAFIRENLQAVYQLMEAADGVQGYQQATEQIPDLILSDVMMPKMDGVELCAKLKADEKTAHIPVILLTAKASGGDKIEGLKTGADDYIIKPFKADELLVRIKNLIESRKKLREQFSREITLQPRSVKVSSADERFLQRLMEIMEEHMADFTFGVESLGKALGMSRVQLYRKLKALTNQSPGDFIRMMRLKRAAELLSQESGGIAEVAYAVGFNDPSYFSKSFHKQYGQTPTEYVSAIIS